MAAPVFHAAGSAVYTADNVANPTTLSPTAPTRTAGDLLVMVVCCRNKGPSISVPTGYTNNIVANSATASGGTIQIFWRIATNTAADNASTSISGLTTGTSGDSCSARILSYTNGVMVQDAVGGPTDTAATTSWTMNGATTTVANSMVLGISLKISDTSQTTTITNYTERSDDNTQTGTGHITQVSEHLNVAAGLNADGVVTPSNTTSSRILTLATGFRGGTQVLLDPASAVSSTSNLVLSQRVLLEQRSADFLNDTFTDSDATAITSHTGETGATWTRHTSYTVGAKIASNRVEGESVTGLHYASAVPSTADYAIEATIRNVTLFANAGSGVAARVNTAADTYYVVKWQDLFAGFVSGWVLQKVVAGVVTTLDANAGDTPANGTDRVVRLDVRGTVLTVYVDGVRRIQVSDASIASAGRAGVKTELGTSTTGFHIDAITAWTPSALTAAGLSSATLALTAQTAIPLGTASAQSSATLVFKPYFSISSSAQSSATLALTAPAQVVLGSASATSSATIALGAPALLSLGAASALSSATLVFKPYFAISASGQSSATLALTAPATVSLGASSAQSSDTLALTAQTYVPLGAASALSSATLAVAAPMPVVLGASSGVSSATLAVSAQTTVALGASSAVCSATLSLAQYVPLGVASAVSSATLALSAKTTVALNASSGVASATLNLAQYVPLGVSSAQSSATLALITQTAIPLGASAAQSSATLALTAKTAIPLGASSAVSSATLAVTAGASTVPLAAASATSSATLSLTAATQIALGAANAQSSATLAATAKTIVPLLASSAQASASLAISLPTPAILALAAGNAQASATLAASAKTTAILQSAGIAASATLALSAQTLIVLVTSSASSSATLVVTAPFFTLTPQWDQHTDSEWTEHNDSEWVSSPDVASAALYPSDDLYPGFDLYPSQDVEGGDWEQSSDQEWILTV